MREGLCSQCGELAELPYKAYERYFCCAECLAAFEADYEDVEGETPHGDW
jgi:hypothetical protein